MKSFFTILTLLVGTALSQEILEVTCGKDAIEARFNRQTAVAAKYTMQQLHFNDPDCVFDQAVEGYYVRRIEPLDACGTDVTVNKTHAKYTNSISSGEIETGLSFPHGIIVGQPENVNLISVSYECTYKIDIRVSTSFIPNITIVKIPIPDAIGEGFFEVTMALYRDATYMSVYENVPVLQPDETIFVGIAMSGDTSEGVYILMRRCWATPNEDPDSEPYYSLIEDSCPVEGAVQGSLAITQNGIAQQALWQTKVFRFVGDGDTYQNVWLHCDLTLCVTETCEPTCSARRKRRSVEESGDPHIVSIGPLSQAGTYVNVKVDPDGSATVIVKNETGSDFDKHASERSKASERSEWYERPELLIGVGAFAAFCMLCLTVALIVVLMRLKRTTRTPHGDVTPTGTINKGFSI